MAGPLSLGVAWTPARVVKQLLAERDLRALMPSIQSLHPALILVWFQIGKPRNDNSRGPRWPAFDPSSWLVLCPLVPS